MIFDYSIVDSLQGYEKFKNKINYDDENPIAYFRKRYLEQCQNETFETQQYNLARFLINIETYENYDDGINDYWKYSYDIIDYYFDLYLLYNKTKMEVSSFHFNKMLISIYYDYVHVRHKRKIKKYTRRKRSKIWDSI